MSEDLREDGSNHTLLVNTRTRAVIASDVELALTQRARRVGLLGRSHLAPAHALYLMPCMGIHTAFMRFAIDVIFVRRDGTAVKIIHRLKPWRAAFAIGAYAVIELAGGTLRRHDLRIGDALRMKSDETVGRGHSPAPQAPREVAGTTC
jgi:uncharacterized membrane protein (UPF0127 family)